MIEASTAIVRTLIAPILISGANDLSGPDGPVAGVRIGWDSKVAAYDVGEVYFVDALNHLIRKVAGGIVTTIVGGGSRGDGGLARNAFVYRPTDLTVDAAGDLYVATPAYGEVRKISVVSESISTPYRGPIGTDQLYSPTVVAMGPANTLYFGGRAKIYKAANGSETVVAGGGSIASTFQTGMLATDLNLYLSSFAVAPSGEIYFLESYRKGLNKIELDGRITNYPINTFPPTKMIVEPSGSILLGTTEGLYRFTPSTNILSLLYYVKVSGLAVDAVGNIYFSDWDKVWRIDHRSGEWTYIAGGGLVLEPADGTPAENAKFATISGLALDKAGNIFLTDELASSIWRLTPKPEITIVSLLEGQVGKPYTASLTAQFGTKPHTWALSEGSLPLGLSINSTAARVEGIPQVAGSSTFTLLVTDAVGAQVRKQYTIKVVESWPSAALFSPQTASGVAQDFTITMTTPAESPVLEIQLFIGDFLAANNGCMIRSTGGGFSMVADGGGSWVAPSNGVLSNGKCALSIKASSYRETVGGGALTTTVKVAVQALPGFAGTKRVLLYILGPATMSSGWIERGVWTIPHLPVPKPAVGPIDPVDGAGTTQTFSSNFNHSRGASNIYLAYLLLLPTPNIVQYTAAGSCLVEYNSISHAMRLINEAGDDWLGPLSGVPLSQGGTLSNSRCTLNIGKSSAQLSSTTLVVNAAVTLNQSFTGTLGLFLQAQDIDGFWTGMTQFGNWTGTVASTPKPGPYVVGMTPTAALGSATYKLTVGHTSGISKLGMVHLRFSSGIVGAEPCHVIYFPGDNTINLINDAGTDLEAPPGVKLGSVGISTQRCTIAAGATRSVEGNTLTLTLPMHFNRSTFLGAKTAYANVFDNAGNLTHWITVGTLNVP